VVAVLTPIRAEAPRFEAAGSARVSSIKHDEVEIPDMRRIPWPAAVTGESSPDA
jgi:hypothetical protein